MAAGNCGEGGAGGVGEGEGGEGGALDCGHANRYLCLFVCVVSEPAVGFSKVIKHMDTPLGASGLQHNGGGRIHFCTDPAAVEDIEHQHAEEEEGANDADISGELLLGIAKEVETVEWRGLGGSLCGVLCATLRAQQGLSATESREERKHDSSPWWQARQRSLLQDKNYNNGLQPPDGSVHSEVGWDRGV